MNSGQGRSRDVERRRRKQLLRTPTEEVRPKARSVGGADGCLAGTRGNWSQERLKRLLGAVRGWPTGLPFYRERAAQRSIWGMSAKQSPRVPVLAGKLASGAAVPSFLA